jgi:GR25 family glycosyltransferase involved in LPS biosynthesis
MKFENFPEVYWLSLFDATERQSNMREQFSKYGITNHTMIAGYDARVPSFNINEIVTGPYFHQMKKTEIACTISHLKMIKHWINNSNSEHAVFFEDDINLEVSDFWTFTWEDVFNNLPKNWKAIQMCLVRNTEINEIQLKPRVTTDWSTTAYIMHRRYGEEIVKKYCLPDDKYIINVVGDHRSIPFAENVVYFMAEPDVYILPIFTENVAFPSTNGIDLTISTVKENNFKSEKYVMDWWKFFGKTTSIKNIITTHENVDWSKALPVIGTTVVNSTDWIKRLLLSVDYPVENFLIINNNGRGELNEELNKLHDIAPKFIKKLSILEMPQNIGVACSWNLIIKCYLNSPYWMIVGDDIAFTPGFLKEMYKTVNLDEHIGMIHGYGGDFGDGAWDLFLIRDIIIKIFGLFDENTYPAYCEDADYIMRLIHRPIKKVTSLKSTYYHGPGVASEYYTHGSQTKKKSGELFEKLTNVNLMNFEYLTKKWGDNWRMSAPTKLPFEGHEIPISYTSFDLDFIRKKHLGF